MNVYCLFASVKELLTIPATAHWGMPALHNNLPPPNTLYIFNMAHAFAVIQACACRT